MASELLTDLSRATDSNNAALSGAVWYFYDTGTTTPHNVYSDASLSTSLGSTVTADAGGQFVAIYFDAAYQYRGILKTAGGTTLKDIDPINPGVLAQLSSATSGKGASLVKLTDGGTVQDELGNLSFAYNATADGATDDRTYLAAAITRGAGKQVHFPGNYSTSAGTAWTDTLNSDPEPSALTVTTTDTVISGENTGTITVDTADKGVIHVVNDTEASRPVGVTVKDITLGQPYSTIISAGLTDDYFCLRFEGGTGCLADNVRFNACEIALTFQFVQTVTYYTTVSVDATATGVSTANDTITATAHGLSTGDPFYLSPGTSSAWTGTLPVGTGIEFGVPLYAIVVDANTLKLATSAANAAASTAIDITAVGTGTLTIQKDVRYSKKNRSRDCYAPSVAFMGMQIFGEREGVHTGHTFHGIDADGTSRAAAHGVRMTGYDFCPTRDNVVTGHTVSRFTYGLSLQTYVQRNEISLTAYDCDRGADIVRQTTRDRVQHGNMVSLRSYGGSYGLYDNGSRDCQYDLYVESPSSYGIEATNSGVQTFNASTGVTTGTDQIAITSHGFVTGDGVIVGAKGATLPTGTGISNGAQLYVVKVDANNIKLATSYANAIAGTVIDITAVGSGTVTLYPTDWNTNNSYRGQIIKPGARGANLNSVCRTHIDLDIVGSGAATTTYGLICSGPYLRGRLSVRDCNLGAFLSGEFANLHIQASDCTTPLQITGHNNVIFCDIVGNISVSGNNNTIFGTVTGTVTDTGSGNRIMVAQQTGWTAGTGTANKGAFATYAGQTVSAAYVQAEAQATDDAVKANSQRIKAIEDAMRNLDLIDG